MKKITLLLSVMILSSAVFAQDLIPDYDLEKMQMLREQTAVQVDQINEKNPDAQQFPMEPSDAMFDLLFQFPVGDGTGEYAVATDGNFIYTSKWNAPGNFFKYEMNGTFIGSFTIAGASSIRDLTYDGTYFYGSPNTGLIYQMDFTNQTLVGTINATGTVRAIAYDAVADAFWVSNGWNPPLRLISRTGTVLATLNTAASSFSALAWENVTDGSPHLWAYTQPASNNILVQINIETGATIQTYDVASSVTFGADAISGGMVITDLVFPGKWAFLGTAQNDVIWAMELADAAPLESPAAPTNLAAVAGAMGALSAEISFNNPSTTVGGDPLTELTAMMIHRNGDLIHTVANPVIGGAVTYTDNAVPAAGNVTYSVVGENTAGAGIPANVTAYVGPDVPAAPGNVLLVAQGNNGFVTWNAPTAGLNGGYFTGDNVTYTVKRFPGAVQVAENITALEFLDTNVPGIGNYFYEVTASNPIGVGGTGTSNVALLGAEGILLYETFNHAVNTLPPGWQLEGLGAGNWGIQNTASAGGTAPEMRLNWSPSFNGLSRLITPAINSQDFTALRIKLNQYLNNYSVNAGEEIAIELSTDGGTNWTSIWSFIITDSYGPVFDELYFSVPAQTNFHIGFRFEGNSFNINQWYFDNVTIEPVLSNDLAAVSISGNVTPTVGEESNYQVVVQNAGASDVMGSAYSVKLFKEGGVMVDQVPGVDINAAAQATFTLSWTPDVDGPTYLYGYVDYPDDDVPGNNTTPDLNINVQPSGIIAITIGTGTNYPVQRMPFDFFWKNSLRQTLYYASEINLGGGVVTALKYTNNFATSLPGKEVNIWIGETEATNLTGGWIDPATLTLVYSGTVDFPIGENDILITLTNPYIYTGGNLVVYSHRVWEDQYFSSLDRFYGTNDPGSSRTIGAQADATVYDPAAPPAVGFTSDWHPNTTLFFSLEGLGSLSGTVTEATKAPVEGVLVKVLGTMAETYTNASGEYSFPALLAGTYEVEFSKYGYETHVAENVVIVADENTVVNAALNTVDLPQIAVSPESISVTVPEGGTSEVELTISNLGELPLIWSGALQYPDKSYLVYPVPEGELGNFHLDLSMGNSIPGGEPTTQSSKDEVMLNYDGPNDDAIGLTAGGTFHLAARFPSAMVAPYAGYMLESVDLYINDVPSSAILKIWGAGTSTSPGAVLHEQTFSSNANSWITIALNDLLLLDGTDIWVGYTVTHGAGQFPAGCDAGPAHPEGDWISTDGTTWQHLAGFGLNFNWNVRARLFPGTTPWVNFNPKQGEVAGGDSQVVLVTFDASEVDPGTYNAHIVLNSNDPLNPEVMVPITFIVGVDILPGDANCDGQVNVIDVITIINFILGNDPQPFCFENADVNGDGTVNVLDAIGTVNIILGTKANVPLNSSAANIYLNQDNIKLQSDGTLAGLQFEIIGMEMNQLRFALTNHQFASNIVDGRLIGVIFSLDNTPIPAGEVTLFNFEQTSGLKWGNVIAGNLNAENVKINKSHGAEFQLSAFPNPSQGLLTVEVNTPATSEAVVSIIDMMGREVSTLHQGLLSEGTHRYELSAALRSGLYFLKVQAITENAEVITKHLKLVVTE